MDFFKKLLRDKKSINNVMTALFIGVLLIIMSSTLFKDRKTPQKEETNEIPSINSGISEDDYEKKLEDELEETLSLVEGVGKIKVMIKLSEGSESVYKNDTKKESYDDDGSVKSIDEEKTVFTNGGEPVVLKEVKPKVEGVIVVAQGGDDVMVKKSLIDSIKALLGIEAHKIEILKMK